MTTTAALVVQRSVDLPGAKVDSPSKVISTLGDTEYRAPVTSIGLDTSALLLIGHMLTCSW